MESLKKFIAPALAAVITAAVMYGVQSSGCDGSEPVPALPALTHETAQRDSVDLDSLKARLVADLKPVYRVKYLAVHDTSAVDSVIVHGLLAEQVRIDSAALAESHDVIRILNERLDASTYIRDIIAMHDTTIVDSTKESVYWLHQSYSYRLEHFGLTLKHEYLAREPTIWRYVQSLGPWVAGAVAVVKIIADSFKP